MKSLFLLPISVLIIVSCEATTQNDKPPKETTIDVEVSYFGALKEIMHKGDLSGKAKLSDYTNKKHLYAIGAFENLKGEIQIFDGKSFATYVEDSVLRFDPTFNKNAALIVSAEVEKWDSYKIPSNIRSYAELETYVQQIAAKHKIRSHRPFPFLVEGTPKTFDWHVIDWEEGDTVHSHEKHVNSGLHGTIENRAVTLLGFYSDAHHTIFTHHSTNMHIHFKTADGRAAGHLDDLTLGQGMTLKLPASE